MSEHRDVTFESDGIRCAAWHVLPEHRDTDSPRAPCVVMAHGFGATRHMGLLPYAARFAQAGFHVLVFDYRYLGDSGGEPRQRFHVATQLGDWEAALRFARTLPGVDPKRIALWGTSMSGGHAVVTAARDGTVAAVVAQVPMLDGRGAFALGLRHAGVARALRLSALALSDRRALRQGHAPRQVPIVAPHGKLALMAAPDALAGVLAIAGPEFVNTLNASCVLEIATYRPVVHIEAMRCPVLLQAARNDSVVPLDAIELAARRAGGIVQLERYGLGHFDIYVGQGFERTVSDQTAFLRRHLGRIGSVRP